MTSGRWCFIFNPNSGHNRRHPERLEQVAHFIRTHGLDAGLERTSGPGHATELARQAVLDGVPRIVAIGGDGLMNEIAAALVGTPVALGLVSCGSGNGLARHLGIYGPFQRSLEALLTARERLIDSAAANDRPFFNVLGMGFDADIADRFNHLEKRGLASYLRTGLAAWRGRRAEAMRIRHEGGVLETRMLLLAAANSDQYGNNARIAPGARVDDGRLDLVIIPPVSTIGAIPLLARLACGSLDRGKGVIRLGGERFVIEREAPGFVHVDGEVFTTGATVEVSVRPASLRVLA